MKQITRRSFFETAGFAAALPALSAIAGQAQDRRTSVSVQKDVIFGKGGDMDLRCDIYRPPAGTEKRMATILFHGGGFTGGSKDNMNDRGRIYAAQGYVAIASQYRLAGQAKYPALVEDMKAAIRWTRANASSLNIDPKRIGVAGFSAGGYLALFAAGTQNRPEFEGKGGNPGVGTEIAVCVAYYPVAEIRPRADGTATDLLPAGSNADAHRAASPITYVSRGFAPTVIFHGVEDITIPIESSQRLFQHLRDARVPAELHQFEGVPHVFDSHPEFATPCVQLADLFFDRHVLNPRKYPPWQGGGGRRGRG